MRGWTFVGLVLGGGIVATVGLGWYVFHQPMNLDSPVGEGFADGFRTEFKASCRERMLADAPDEASKAKITAYCSCAADAMFEEYKDDPPAKLFSLGSDEAEQATIQRIMTTCSQQAGLQ